MKCSRAGAAALAAVVLGALAADAPLGGRPGHRPGKAPAAAAALKINVLSNRADLISGGDALVQIVVPSGVDPSTVTVDVGGRDVTSAFAVRADGRFLGRVDGLALGPNVLTAKLPNKHGARITITNHPNGGPVFSGAQIQPWLCTTTRTGSARRRTRSATRRRRTSTSTCRSTGAGFQPYDPASPPADVATTTTDQGKTVPYIIRQETGTQNRGIYRIAVLSDPTQAVEPWAPQPGWNHKLFYPLRRELRDDPLAVATRRTCRTTSRSRAASWSRRRR